MKVIRSLWSLVEGHTKPGGRPCNNRRKGQHTAERRERKADTIPFIHRHLVFEKENTLFLKNFFESLHNTKILRR